jgi:hypothetical protein
VVSNRVQLVHMESGGRNRRISLDLQQAPLQTVVARLPPEDPAAHAVLRAAALSRLGKLDKAIAELQNQTHPLAAALREAIIQQPAAKP